MTRLSPAQIAAYVRGAGFPEEHVPRMTAIALAESSGNPAAHNPNARTGDNSYGLFQVNMIGGMGPERRRQFGLSANEELFDPAVNAAAARRILESQGFNAWSVHRSGAYRRFMDQAQQGASASAAGGSALGGAAGPGAMNPAALLQPVTPDAMPTPERLAGVILNTSFTEAAGFASRPTRMAGSNMPAISQAAFGMDPDQVNAMLQQSSGASTPAPTVTRGRLGGASTNWKRDPDAEQSGYDISKPGGVGAPILAPVDLRITGKGFQGQGSGETGRGYGRWLSGRFTGTDGRPYELLLGHLNDYAVKPGSMVPAGTVLGTQGVSGRAFGPHVTTHVNALGGGDPWAQLNAITKRWTAPL